MKRILISILVSIFVISIFSVANAATASVVLEPSTSKVKPGETFTISVIASGDANVTGIEGKLSYDTAKLLLEKKDTLNGFQEAGSGNILNSGILSLEGVTLAKSVKVYTLTFKALETAEGETLIEFKNIELGLVDESSNQKDVTAADASVKVTIEKEEVKEPTDEPTEPDDDKTTADKEENNTKLPQTGAEKMGVIVVVALGIVSIISYVFLRRYRDI